MSEQEEFLTPGEVAKQLHISTKTVIRLIRSGQLVAHKVGQRYRISRADFRKYLQVTREDHPTTE
jgi:excisionase family DNA binding protein